MRELLMAGAAVEVSADEIKSLDVTTKTLVGMIQSSGLRPEHFQDRQVSEVLRAVQAVAMQDNLTYDQVKKFPGYGSTPDLLQLWLEFVFLTRLGMSNCRELAARTAVVCYLPFGKRYRMQHMLQPVGSLPLAVLHGNQGSLWFRIYEPSVDEQGLTIGAHNNTVSHDLSLLPGVPSHLILARKNGFKDFARVEELQKTGLSLEQAKTQMKVEALEKAATKITAIETRGINYAAFSAAKPPRINVCDERVMRAAVGCLTVFRDVMRWELLRDKIQQLVRRYNTTRAEALAQPGRLGKEHANFLEMCQQRRELLSRFRNTAPILPDYLATFNTAEVAQNLRDQAILSDDETTLLPAAVINEECENPAAAFQMATDVSEDWSSIARWETRCQYVPWLKFDAASASWQYKLQGSEEIHSAAPDEIEELFHWTPQPYAMIKPRRIMPEDLQIREHVRADLSDTSCRDARWR